MSEGFPLGWRQLAVIGVPPLWAIGRLLSGNFNGIVRIERPLAVFVTLWVLGIAVALGLAAMGVSRRPASYVAFLLLALLVGFGPVMRQFGDFVGLLVFAAALIVGAWLFIRFGDGVAARVIVAVVVVAMLSGPLVDTFRTAAKYGESSVVNQEPMTLELTERPNIWLVVLDGYPGRISIRADHGIPPEDQLQTHLEERGFEVPASVWASYPSTRLSVPSLLDMAYLVRDWAESPATDQDLYNIVAGDSRLIEVLNDNGYFTQMVEPGWSGGDCHSQYDVCVASPFYDAAMNFVAFESILGDTDFVRPGYAFAVGSQSTMSWLREHMGGVGGDDDAPSFVYAHVLAPHPPFFLDESCERVVDHQRDGFFYTYGDVPHSKRAEFFSQQIACVDSFVEEFVAGVSEDDLVILVSDHGTGTRAQMGTDPDDWDVDAIRERMNALVAVRSPVECQIGDRVFIPNVMRRVLSCLSDDDVPDLGEEMHVGAHRQVDPETLALVTEP